MGDRAHSAPTQVMEPSTCGASTPSGSKVSAERGVAEAWPAAPESLASVAAFWRVQTGADGTCLAGSGQPPPSGARSFAPIPVLP